MNCPYCGSEHLPEHGLFCDSCGLRVGRASTPAPRPAAGATRPRDDDLPLKRCPVCGIGSTTRAACPQCGCELLLPP